MNEKQKKEYLEGGAQTCPFCKSEDISATSTLETDCLTAWDLIECGTCGKKWHDVFNLVDIEEVT